MVWVNSSHIRALGSCRLKLFNRSALHQSFRIALTTSHQYVLSQEPGGSTSSKRIIQVHSRGRSREKTDGAEGTKRTYSSSWDEVSSGLCYTRRKSRQSVRGFRGLIPFPHALTSFFFFQHFFFLQLIERKRIFKCRWRPVGVIPNYYFLLMHQGHQRHCCLSDAIMRTTQLHATWQLASSSSHVASLSENLCLPFVACRDPCRCMVGFGTTCMSLRRKIKNPLNPFLRKPLFMIMCCWVVFFFYPVFHPSSPLFFLIRACICFQEKVPLRSAKYLGQCFFF